MENNQKDEKFFEEQFYNEIISNEKIRATLPAVISLIGPAKVKGREKPINIYKII